MPDGAVVVVGGTSGIGRAIAETYAVRGRRIVITGRDAARAETIAGEIGGDTSGLAVDLTSPGEVAARFDGIGPVQGLVLAAIQRDENRAREFDLEGATRLVTLKLVGYIEVVHALAPQLSDDSAIVLFGGLAKDRPYPGSTTVSTVNGGVTGMVHTLAVELAPIRVNAIHPGITGDSPAWSGKPPALLDGVRARTPTGRLVTMREIADATVFLLENTGVNGVNLHVDGGTLLT